MGDTPAGNASRVINALKEFQKLADKDKEHLDKVVSRKEELQNLVWSPDHSYSDQLAACEKEASRLRKQIAMRAESSRISNECACYRPARRCFFCGLFLPHAILYNKKQHDRIC